MAFEMEGGSMKAYTYIEKGHFELLDKPKPEILDPKDAVVRVTLGSICSFPLSCIDEAYRLFENKEDGVIKVAVRFCQTPIVSGQL